MNDRFFLDTNVIVYSFDKSTPAKRDRARDLIGFALSTGKGIISFQVVQEFLNVATKKFPKPLTGADACAYLEEVLQPLCEVFPSSDFYTQTLDVKERTRFSFYDAMIVRAAIEGGCATLYSEDMQDGFRLFDVTIVNPFAGR